MQKSSQLFQNFNIVREKNCKIHIKIEYSKYFMNTGLLIAVFTNN